MNTLKVSCKIKNKEEINDVCEISFSKKILIYAISENKPDILVSISIYSTSFENIEWVDFGTTRWYPNNL